MVLGVEIEQHQFVARCLNQRTYSSAERPVKQLAQSKILRMSEFPVMAVRFGGQFTYFPQFKLCPDTLAEDHLSKLSPESREKDVDYCD